MMHRFVNIQCPCGSSDAISYGDEGAMVMTQGEALHRIVEHLGWSYVRAATAATKDRGYTHEGVCSECLNLTGEDGLVMANQQYIEDLETFIVRSRAACYLVSGALNKEVATNSIQGRKSFVTPENLDHWCMLQINAVLLRDELNKLIPALDAAIGKEDGR